MRHYWDSCEQGLEGGAQQPLLVLRHHGRQRPHLQPGADPATGASRHQPHHPLPSIWWLLGSEASSLGAFNPAVLEEWQHAVRFYISRRNTQWDVCQSVLLDAPIHSATDVYEKIFCIAGSRRRAVVMDRAKKIDKTRHTRRHTGAQAHRHRPTTTTH